MKKITIAIATIALTSFSLIANAETQADRKTEQTVTERSAKAPYSGQISYRRGEAVEQKEKTAHKAYFSGQYLLKKGKRISQS